MSSVTVSDGEEILQRSFEQVKVGFSPACCLSITVLRCRDVSVSYIRDKFDTPDPQFIITCPKLGGTNSFKTTSKSNSPTCEINETFNFVLPKTLTPDETFPVKIELYDDDILINDFLGAKTIDVSKMAIGASENHTLGFGNHGEVDITISKEVRSTSDLRLSVSLHQKERAYRKKRFPIVFEALQGILSKADAPTCVNEAPVVSLVCSGGGYRATVGMCGAMEAIKDAGLIDVLSYAVGLSGSSWYLTSAYAWEAMTPDKQAEFHSHLRESLQTNIIQDFVNPIHLANYSNYIQQKSKFSQPSSFVDFFGYSVGKHLLGEERLDKRLSDLQPYVEEGRVPFPLFASLNVRNTVAASKYHAYLDISPFEIGFPKFGMGVDPSCYGSTFCSGILSRKCPEMPIHFIQGMCGCAFSILLKQLLEKGGEKSNHLLDHIDEVRTSRSPIKKNPDVHEIEFDSDASGDTDDEDEVESNANAAHRPTDVDGITKDKSSETQAKPSAIDLWIDIVKKYFTRGWNFVFGIKSDTVSAQSSVTADSTPEDESFFASLRGWSFLSNRDALIGRTAKVFNVAHGFDNLSVFCMNPFVDPSTKPGEPVMDKLVMERHKKISTRKEVISIADAGVLKNVPTELALRPQRATDILVVLDFNGYASDSNFDYMPLLAAATHSEIQGLNFPGIDFKEVTEMPPTNFFLIEGNEEHPTVLWFTLCNEKFKNIENYRPRHSEEFTTGESFNSFPVYDPGNRYSTFKFDYSHEDFDRLRDLMYFNVSSHKDDIKEALAKHVQIKRQRGKK